jgi:hypothetical protein
MPSQNHAMAPHPARHAASAGSPTVRPAAASMRATVSSSLEQNYARYDLIVAAGVLYHMTDPLRFLEAAAARTDAIYLWTHVIDGSKLPADHPGVLGLEGSREAREFSGEQITLYRRSYLYAHENADYCGGIYDGVRWMTRQSVFDALAALGFTSLEIAHETPPTGSSRAFPYSRSDRRDERIDKLQCILAEISDCDGINHGTLCNVRRLLAARGHRTPL